MNIKIKLIGLFCLMVGVSGCSGAPYEGSSLPIQSSDYDRYFILKGVDNNYISKQIHEYGDLWGTENQSYYAFDFATSGEWQIVKVAPQLPFYQYHNLIAWFFGDGTQAKSPTISIGLALHGNDSSSNHVIFMDASNSWGDTELVLFQDGKEGFVYLPEAYETVGNLKILNSKLSSFTDLDQYLTSLDFDQTILDSLVFETEEIGLEKLE